ncbi:hypothetical protein BDA96_10G088100 [Sorghum bicolor]|uniref:Uncharacterized protein n=1 Tax=Sorghum bicolor TaxID=4558 RepID=A0A921TZN8_SORBI|nr:hypothetical protein BDA96_10G088100 [Sorghum bicolor]
MCHNASLKSHTSAPTRVARVVRLVASLSLLLLQCGGGFGASASYDLHGQPRWLLSLLRAVTSGLNFGAGMSATLTWSQIQRLLHPHRRPTPTTPGGSFTHPGGAPPLTPASSPTGSPQCPQI